MATFLMRIVRAVNWLGTCYLRLLSAVYAVLPIWAFVLAVLSVESREQFGMVLSFVLIIFCAFAWFPIGFRNDQPPSNGLRMFTANYRAALAFLNYVQPVAE